MPHIIYIVGSHLNSLSFICHAQAQSDRLGVGQGQGQAQIVCMETKKLIIPATTWFKAVDGPFHACISIIVSRMYMKLVA